MTDGAGSQDRPTSAIRVLIVDDDDLVAESLARCCQAPDLSVVGTASHAAGAVGAALQHRPDVILVDHRLGDDDGVTVAAKLLALVPTTKVVIVTGAATPELERAARLAGCSGCVQKDMQVAHVLPSLVRRAYAGQARAEG